MNDETKIVQMATKPIIKELSKQGLRIRLERKKTEKNMFQLETRARLV